MNIEIEEMKRISLKPGEIILIRSRFPLPAFRKEDIQIKLKKSFPNNEILIVDGDVNFSIVEKASA